METQECLDNLDQALIAEGVPEEERLQRVQTLKECIEFGETTSAKIKEQKKKKEEKKITVSLRATIEWCVISFLLGACAMGYAVQYSQSQ